MPGLGSRKSKGDKSRDLEIISERLRIRACVESLLSEIFKDEDSEYLGKCPRAVWENTRNSLLSLKDLLDTGNLNKDVLICVEAHLNETLKPLNKALDNRNRSLAILKKRDKGDVSEIENLLIRYAQSKYISCEIAHNGCWCAPPGPDSKVDIIHDIPFGASEAWGICLVGDKTYLASPGNLRYITIPKDRKKTKRLENVPVIFSSYKRWLSHLRSSAYVTTSSHVLEDGFCVTVASLSKEKMMAVCNLTVEGGATKAEFFALSNVEQISSEMEDLKSKERCIHFAYKGDIYSIDAHPEISVDPVFWIYDKKRVLYRVDGAIYTLISSSRGAKAGTSVPLNLISELTTRYTSAPRELRAFLEDIYRVLP